MKIQSISYNSHHKANNRNAFKASASEALRKLNECAPLNAWGEYTQRQLLNALAILNLPGMSKKVPLTCKAVCAEEIATQSMMRGTVDVATVASTVKVLGLENPHILTK